MLGTAGIRSADGADIAVAPRLLANPFGRVVAVAHVVAMRSPTSFGAIAATYVLHDDHVTATDEVLHPFRPLRVPTKILSVRRPLQDHRELSGYRDAVKSGSMDIGRQPHSVAHGHHDVPAESDTVARLALGR